MQAASVYVLAYFPVGHSVQLEEPGFKLTVPGAQLEHTDNPYEPIYFPSAHDVQPVEPSTLEYVPGGHKTDAVAAVTLTYHPLGAGLQTHRVEQLSKKFANDVIIVKSDKYKFFMLS